MSKQFADIDEVTVMAESLANGIRHFTTSSQQQQHQQHQQHQHQQHTQPIAVTEPLNATFTWCTVL